MWSPCVIGGWGPGVRLLFPAPRAPVTRPARRAAAENPGSKLTEPPSSAYINRPRSAPLSTSSISVPSQGTRGLVAIISKDSSRRGQGRLLPPPDPWRVVAIVRCGSWSRAIRLVKREINRVRGNSSSSSRGTTYPSYTVASQSTTTPSGKQHAIRFAMCYTSCRTDRYSGMCTGGPGTPSPACFYRGQGSPSLGHRVARLGGR